MNFCGDYPLLVLVPKPDVFVELMPSIAYYDQPSCAGTGLHGICGHKCPIYVTAILVHFDLGSYSAFTHPPKILDHLFDLGGLR